MFKDYKILKILPEVWECFDIFSEDINGWWYNWAWKRRYRYQSIEKHYNQTPLVSQKVIKRCAFWSSEKFVSF